ncbi:MAG: AmmeMemoRadiSam system protein B [Planctomycetia bacterium]|nr:AmmeMemoRadiSam system protein B [Planctomycetia bacterium]
MSEQTGAAARPDLTDQQEQLLFRAAARRVAAAVAPQPPGTSEPLPDELGNRRIIGAFVSLKRAGQLRSCCGFLGPSVALSEALDTAALRAATDDPRFPPISPTELAHLDMEVWLLWGMKPIEARGEDRIRAVEIGRHGLQVQRGGARGLLLPAVATEHNLDAEAFLRQTCLKAQLPPDAWKDDATRVNTFEGYAIRGPLGDVFEPEQLELPEPSPAGPTELETARLADFCRANLLAMVQGATPGFYLPGAFDGNVNGVAVAVTVPALGQTLSSNRLSIKPGMPLQATLSSLIQALANMLRARRADPATLRDARVGLSILWDPAMHGAADQPDLSGVYPARRALAAMTPSGWAWLYDPGLAPDVLLADVLSSARVAEPAGVSVLSLAICSTEHKAAATNIVPPDAPRPAAVAGLFYPGSADEITRSLDTMLPGRRKPEHWAGAMVPHAGWVYSGKLAAGVLGRIAIPSRVIIFSPKHKPGGADWAVAPNSRWQLPGRDVASDPELAARLAESIDGLALDAVSHRAEHAIEVQLPILARLAPDARVVGIAMHDGDWPALARFAEQLAGVLSELPEPPLLVISTDMNHFADDAETRRRDRLALDAIEALDPRRLLDVVRSESITMCGVTGAVVVMETLRRLGHLTRCESVGYQTSFDTTGDPSRVVGYAGMLFD